MDARGADRRHATQPFSPQATGLVADRRKPDDRRQNGFISRLQLFSNIPYDVIETVLADCDARNVPAGAVLLEPGQSNNGIHLLVSGRLRIHFDHKDSADFIPIEEGGCFGELSIIDGRPVSAFVVADAPSRVLVVPDGIFWGRLIPFPGVARNLLNVLSERMRANGEMLLARMKDRLELEHLQKELSIAHTIQLSMLPPGDRLFPDRTEVRAHAIMEPAKDVGGDFYDAFFATPDRLFVAIGDVSGKGVPAALFMAKTMTLMRMEAVRRRSPSAILEAVNRALCEGNDSGMFVTLFCGILEIESGLFSFANAGHNPPLLLGSDGQCRFLTVKKGLVAGIMEGSRYPQVNLLMLPGESVLLYTDGVTEALNPREDLYTEERLVENAGKCRIDSPRELVESIRASIADFVKTAPQADDITMFALAYVGANTQ